MKEADTTIDEAAAAHGLRVVGGEPLVLHCHHYNAVLQQSIGDTSRQLPMRDVLRDGVVTPAYRQLRSMFGGHAPERRLELGADWFRQCGFGLLDVSELEAAGGKARVRNSHYALGFAARREHGSACSEPCCHVAAGFVEALAAVAFETEAGTFEAVETECAALGADRCTFEVTRLDSPRPVPASVGVGTLPSGSAPPAPPDSNVDEGAILTALSRLSLEGNEEGLIPAFGVYLTRHYANYYNYVSFELERRVREHKPHLLGAVQHVLSEAGHVCAFNTFGGMMQSPEWEAVVAPMLRERRDWVFGIVACINALGWGRWRVVELTEDERLVLRLDASYESNHYLRAFGQDDDPHCHFAVGAAAGIMNLLYVGDILARPTLDAAYYEKLFSGPEAFHGAERRCRCQGAPHCEIVVERRRYTA